MVQRNCLKCGMPFLAKGGSGTTWQTVDCVTDILCENCVGLWMTFAMKYHITHKIQFPRKDNPAWDAFIDNREKVIFT